MRAVFMCVAVALFSTVVYVNDVRAAEKSIPLDQLPKEVTHAVQQMFSHAKLIKASQEEEDGEIEYEITLKENGKTIDVKIEIEVELEISEIEKEVAYKDLPKAVTMALEKLYPKAMPQSAEAVYEVEDGQQELEFYEVQLKTADGKTVEAKLNASGKIIKDSDDEQEEAGEKEEDD
ncbi:hypothetical protein DTL42_13455 [Bremerella cremea]|uniref:Putative beta-lactamase-inhibitor-like PepSY-like domain-containing protein n=1 Tax=Bremerella cremea TaxID=1031537 RepID=A0A368KSM1_9BACT|nr:PepSY-like domain-containing protein [Bremerella cremea]RCS48325.1 hypothetical protein DTL42_13455 [Bremerella cremea]